MEEIDKLLSDKHLLDNKKLSQVIVFIGDGEFKDGDECFRTLLKNISNDLLIKYAKECLDEGFKNSGYALQDIVNEIGSRLGFKVTSGLYKGNKNFIGFDGVWQQDEEWHIVVEVKTTDAYRIRLDKIADYRKRLINADKIMKNESSILIVVGRNDTGELEAQIRGSKHAWDVRIISVDSLINLLKIKESLSDHSTAQQISEALRPYEFTRVDRLVDLLFLAIKDVEVEETVDDEVDTDEPGEPEKRSTLKNAPVNFHEPALERIKSKLEINFIKQSRSSYSSVDGKTGVIISVSKEHPSYNSQFDARYWFAFHPHQEKFLMQHEEAYACYGCGEPKNLFMLPLSFLLERLPFMWKTENENKHYHHIVIYRKKGKYFLRTNTNEGEHYDNLVEFQI